MLSSDGFSCKIYRSRCRSRIRLRIVYARLNVFDVEGEFDLERFDASKATAAEERNPDCVVFTSEETSCNKQFNLVHISLRPSHRSNAVCMCACTFNF